MRDAFRREPVDGSSKWGDQLGDASDCYHDARRARLLGHVKDGRSELNFSEWGGYGERMKQSRVSAICAHVKQGTMPLAS